MATSEEQVIFLTDKLNALELESRRILRALHWATKVRIILFFGLLLFVCLSAFLFYRLYHDIKTNRIAEVRRVISEQPEKFSQPLTRQIMLLAEEEGPYVADVFRKQAQEDSRLYVDAFDKERTALIANLQSRLEEKLTRTYASMLDEQEDMLKAEFPVLDDPEKLESIRNNMEKIYDQIGKRYFVEYLKSEMEDLAVKIDTFPATEPKLENVPIGEQIATEFLELVRMMIVYADNYVIPDDNAFGDGNLNAVSPARDANPGNQEASSDETKPVQKSTADDEDNEKDEENDESEGNSSEDSKDTGNSDDSNSDDSNSDDDGGEAEDDGDSDGRASQSSNNVLHEITNPFQQLLIIGGSHRVDS